MRDKLFNEIVEAQIDICLGTLINKAEEYAPGADRLHNFRVAATISGDPMKKVLAGMMVKHTTSIYDMCHDDVTGYSEEKWNEKITDHINYLLLLRAVIFEEEGFGKLEETDVLDQESPHSWALASSIIDPYAQPKPWFDGVDGQFKSNDYGK